MTRFGSHRASLFAWLMMNKFLILEIAGSHATVHSTSRVPINARLWELSKEEEEEEDDDEDGEKTRKTKNYVKSSRKESFSVSMCAKWYENVECTISCSRTWCVQCAHIDTHTRAHYNKKSDVERDVFQSVIHKMGTVAFAFAFAWHRAHFHLVQIQFCNCANVQIFTIHMSLQILALFIVRPPHSWICVHRYTKLSRKIYEYDGIHGAIHGTQYIRKHAHIHTVSHTHPCVLSRKLHAQFYRIWFSIAMRAN